MPSERIEKILWFGPLLHLATNDQELIWAAREATKFSHSPYSRFCVGCAIRLKDGTIVMGANQENASYGLCCCAERTTIFSIHNMGRKHEIATIAVAARPADADAAYVGTVPVAPCGACRQVIKESEDLAGEEITILMDCYDDSLVRQVVGIASLLPFAFGPADLGIKI